MENIFQNKKTPITWSFFVFLRFRRITYYTFFCSALTSAFRGVIMLLGHTFIDHYALDRAAQYRLL